MTCRWLPRSLRLSNYTSLCCCWRKVKDRKDRKGNIDMMLFNDKLSNLTSSNRGFISLVKRLKSVLIMCTPTLTPLTLNSKGTLMTHNGYEFSFGKW
jgi:hypothetical protein